MTLRGPGHCTVKHDQLILFPLSPGSINFYILNESNMCSYWLIYSHGAIAKSISKSMHLYTCISLFTLRLVRLISALAVEYANLPRNK